MLALSDYDYLESLEAFQKGWIQVQDISSALVGELAAPKKDSYVMDVCAAPGGKSLHIADKLQGTGCVEARDLTYQKVALIEENALIFSAISLRLTFCNSASSSSRFLRPSAVSIVGLAAILYRSFQLIPHLHKRAYGIKFFHISKKLHIDLL